MVKNRSYDVRKGMCDHGYLATGTGLLRFSQGRFSAHNVYD